MNRSDWAAYGREKLEKVYQAIQPELLLIDALFMEEIEIAEVNEAFQRFKDFRCELDRIRKHESIKGNNQG